MGGLKGARPFIAERADPRWRAAWCGARRGGQVVRASNVSLELDNYDGALSYDNASGPYFGSLNTGNPIRIRAAAATLGGAVFNRWYVIQKNAQEWRRKSGDMKPMRSRPGRRGPGRRTGFKGRGNCPEWCLA